MTRTGGGAGPWARELEELEAVYRHAPVGLAVFDRDLRYVRINDRLAEINGIPAAAHLGHTIREMVPALADELEAVARRVLETGVPVRDYPLAGETAAQPGVIRHWLEQWYPIHDGAGAVVGINIVVEEVTERLRAQEAERAARAEAEAARQRASFLSDASRALVQSLDYEETLQRVARVFVPAMADWCVVDLLAGRDAVELMAVAHVDAESERWARAIRARFPVRLTDEIGLGKVLRTGTSEFFPAFDDSILLAHAQDDDELAALRAFSIGSYLCVPLVVGGRVTGALTFVRTVASGRRYDAEDLVLAEELGRRAATAIDHARAFREAQEASRAKSEFLAVMSHELRTPLNAIAGYVQLLELGLRGPLTEAQRTDLGRIQQSQRHLLGLIDQVLGFARMDAGAERWEPRDVPLADVLATAEAMVLPQARARGLALAIAPAGPDVIACADPEKLQQVLLNLLSNALKFTEAGGAVSVEHERAGNDLLVHVRDTGIGIPADRLARVFEPFVQVDQGLTRRGDGVGLGLAIARDLARGMRGDVTVESVPEEGSTFTVRVPAA